MAVLQAVERLGTPHNSWLIAMLERKPHMHVAVALANKMARGLWAMVTKQEDYRTSGLGPKSAATFGSISCANTNPARVSATACTSDPAIVAGLVAPA